MPGIISIPTAAVVAGPDPEIAPKNRQATMVAAVGYEQTTAGGYHHHHNHHHAAAAHHHHHQYQYGTAAEWGQYHPHPHQVLKRTQL